MFSQEKEYNKNRSIVTKLMMENYPDCQCLNPWLYYADNIAAQELKDETVGKWLLFSTELEFLNYLCREAVKRGIVSHAKHSFISQKGDGRYVSCFYLNIDDLERHQKIISFLLDNNAIPRSKKGLLYNLSFKLDEQTRKNIYGQAFTAELKLENIIDLKTGEFLQ